MNSLYEFFLCPQHGILRPDNWAPLLAVIQAGPIYMRQTWHLLLSLRTRLFS